MAAAVFVGASVLAQGLVLWKLGAVPAAWLPAFLLLGAAATLVFPRIVHSLTARMTAITLTSGGAGMMIGTWMDGAGCLCSAGPLAMLPTWMNGMMLLFCVPSCWLICQESGFSTRGNSIVHIAGTVFMVVGMMAGGTWLTPPLAAQLASPVLAHHLAMLLGMGVGTALGLVVAVGLLRFRVHAISLSRETLEAVE